MKLLDIENTVERATRNAAAIGATFLTVHAHDGKTLRAAVAGKAGTALEILGVTVLTNLDAGDLRSRASAPRPPISWRAAPGSRARPVATAWSPRARRRHACAPSSGRSMAIVTPGIRLPGDAAGDQARVATPGAGDRRRRRLSRRRPPDHSGGRSGSRSRAVRARRSRRAWRSGRRHSRARIARRLQKRRTPMPKGYVIARATVTNPGAWAEYAAKASEAIKKYGGNPIVRGGRAETIEGQGVARNVVIEFASFEAAKAYATSPEYAAAKKLRQGAGTHRLRRRRRGSLTVLRETAREGADLAKHSATMRRPGGQPC